jgi:hypothetical protein
VVVAGCLVMWETRVDAYIDPGNASYFFQIIAGAALASVFVVRTYWQRIVSWFRAAVSRDSARESRP